MAIKFDKILGKLREEDSGGATDPNNKGYFATEAALTTAFPTGLAGEYALVGSTDSFWTWDADTLAWVNTGTGVVPVWADDGTDATTVNPALNIDLETGGFKDENVVTPVKLGDVLNLEFNTTNKTILGALNEVLATVQSFGNPFQFIGDITLPADFPLPGDVTGGWTYRITADVIDNDATKTNTGQSFRAGDIIAWNGTDWTDITGIEVFIDDGTDVKTINPRNIDLQNKALKNVNEMVFNTTPAGLSGNQGSVYWNEDELTLDLIQNGTTLQLGQETQYNVRNNTGATITNGQLLMASGTIGASGRITATPMDGTNLDNIPLILGVATEEILNGEDGKVTNFGKVRQLNTTGALSFGGLETWNDGDLLYIDAINAGGYLTNIRPTTGMIIPVAFVINSATNGSIQVRVALYNEDHYTTGEVDTLLDGKAQLESGFYNTTDSTLSFDDGTRTFTISPTGADFKYTVNQKIVTVDTPRSIQIPDIEGEHFIYFNDETGTLVSTTTFDPAIIYVYAYVASLYWDATNKKLIVLGEERHGNIMDSETHAHLHLSFGTQYISGLGIANPTLNNITSESGVIRDEDIREPIGAQTTFYKIWREGAAGSWRKSATASALPYTLGANSRVNYNLFSGGTWSLAEAPNATDFCNILLFALNDIRAGHQVVCILDDTLHNTVNEALANIDTEVSTLVTGALNFQEFVPIGVVTVKTDGVVEQLTDLRKSNVSGGGSSFNSHESLSELLGGDANGHYHLTDTELGVVQNINLIATKQSNLTAITAPVATDDSGAGYDVGSLWIDVTNDKAYICLDSTLTTAVWTEITGGASLTVQEVDGTPTATNVDTMIFSNGVVTDNLDGSVNIEITGGALQTADPVITGAATVTEQNTTNLTVTNHGSYTFAVSYTGVVYLADGVTPAGVGSLVDNGDGTITFTAPDVGVDTVYQLGITATELGKTASNEVQHTITVIFVNDIVDGTDNILLEGGTLTATEFPTLNNVVLSSNTLTRDPAVVATNLTPTVDAQGAVVNDLGEIAVQTSGGLEPDGSLNPSTTDSVPAMTSNTAPNGVAFADSSYSSGTDAFEVFDDNTTSYWQSNSLSTGKVGYKFTSAKIINKYTIIPYNNANRTLDPKDWTVEGSNDTTTGLDGTWDTLDTVVGASLSQGVKSNFTFTNSTSYLAYRLNITLNNGSAFILINEIEFIEAQGTADIYFGSSEQSITGIDAATQDNLQIVGSDLDGASTERKYVWFDTTQNGGEYGYLTGAVWTTQADPSLGTTTPPTDFTNITDVKCYLSGDTTETPTWGITYDSGVAGSATTFEIAQDGGETDWTRGTPIVKFTKQGNDVIADGSTNLSTTDSVPLMTSNTAPSGTAFLSTTTTGFDAFRAFDKNDLDGAMTAANTGYVGYIFDTPIAINKYIYVGDPASGRISSNAQDWVIEASNDTTNGTDGTWTTLDTVTGNPIYPATSIPDPRTFTFSNATAYKSYRLRCTLNHGGLYFATASLVLIESHTGQDLTAVDLSTLDYPVVSGEIYNGTASLNPLTVASRTLEGLDTVKVTYNELFATGGSGAKMQFKIDWDDNDTDIVPHLSVINTYKLP